MAEIISNPTDTSFNKDQYAALDKAKVLAQQDKSARYASATQMFTFMAGIMTAGAMGVIVPALQIAGAGLASIPVVGIAFLAAAAISTVGAVVCNVASQKFGASAYFDQSEANARHNAKYIVAEFAKTHCHEKDMEYPQNQRADGKAWADVMQEQAQLVAGASR